ncbi:MAG: 4-hydroxy-tetrahydrodipicolinate reductase [Clostridia bacterium]|nr:4-hydroxy-tetrahydrodipicolinate reductase [Clostridia bacterium]MBR3714718.1 4-hydroxy-tetrahydrodipicolinate reductase [Clostridia bacterium]
MTNIIFCGINGRMGRAVEEIVCEKDNFKIVAGVDLNTERRGDYPVYSKIKEVSEKADVIIDFSFHAELPSYLEYAKANKLPVIIASTGHTPEESALMHEYSKYIPVFFSRNMSLGINLLIELSKKAAAMLGDDFDIEIIEAHHNKKLDAPSGTALMIADAISETLESSPEYVYDRTERREARPKNEIGIHAVRAGGIVGEHSVLFGGKNESVTISHSAFSRSVFALGALRAAEFMVGMPAGFYSMTDLVNNIAGV